ncbi:hypothetical protein JXL21_02635 [Candidatus Bathyarchaeota archaeon]|nr:hypothetical protein [Candidatus Bathyarchaeota archaeon]
MRKKSVVLLLCSVVLASILVAPAMISADRHHNGYRKKPYGNIPASGTWVFYPEHKDLKFGEGYTFVLGNETGEWTGTFEGTDYAIFFAEKNPEGTVVYLPYGVIFFEGQVNGKSGTLRINFGPAVKTGDPMLWSGSWEIMSGTGELENLYGQGTWYETEPTHIVYTGWVQFGKAGNQGYEAD